jgi:hypothetical protein
MQSARATAADFCAAASEARLHGRNRFAISRDRRAAVVRLGRPILI